MAWNPGQYLRFSTHRGRPYQDLVARIGAEPRTVVDLGCGDGSQTATLVQHWPGATVIGIDNSAEMLADAAANHPDVTFRLGAIEEYVPDADVDVLLSNAALQWVPTHRELLTQWVGQLSRGARLAFQVPGNFDAPSHALMREVAAGPEFADAIGSIVLGKGATDTPSEYIALLRAAAKAAGREEPILDAWETSYAQVLPTGGAHHPVLEWTRGTTLVPVRQALDADTYAAYEAAYEERLWQAYPDLDGVVVYNFRRVFVVAQLA